MPVPAVGRADACACKLTDTFTFASASASACSGSTKLGGGTTLTTVRLALAAWQLTTLPHCVPGCSAAAQGSVALWLAAGRLTARVYLLPGGLQLSGWVGMQYGSGAAAVGLARTGLLVTGAEGHTGHCCEAPMPMHAACCRAGRVHLCLSVCLCVRAFVSLASDCSG